MSDTHPSSDSESRDDDEDDAMQQVYISSSSSSKPDLTIHVISGFRQKAWKTWEKKRENNVSFPRNNMDLQPTCL